MIVIHVNVRRVVEASGSEISLPVNIRIMMESLSVLL
jgi:hypothetical protein